MTAEKRTQKEWTLEELLQEASAQRWQFAKTYAKTIPHSYFVREWNKPLYKAFKKAIATYGKKEIFIVFSTRRTYRYLYLGEYRYWICEDVMNRVEIDKIKWDEQGQSYQEK